jgi:hypothetical protein
VRAGVDRIFFNGEYDKLHLGSSHTDCQVRQRASQDGGCVVY